MLIPKRGDDASRINGCSIIFEEEEANELDQFVLQSFSIGRVVSREAGKSERLKDLLDLLERRERIDSVATGLLAAFLDSNRRLEVSANFGEEADYEIGVVPERVLDRAAQVLKVEDSGRQGAVSGICQCTSAS